MGMFLMRFMFNGSVTVSFKTSMSLLLVQRAGCLGGGLRPPAPPCNLGGATAPGPPGPPGEKSRAYGESVRRNLGSKTSVWRRLWRLNFWEESTWEHDAPGLAQDSCSGLGF